jgi:hypothetical protein
VEYAASSSGSITCAPISASVTFQVAARHGALGQRRATYQPAVAKKAMPKTQ